MKIYEQTRIMNKMVRIVETKNKQYAVEVTQLRDSIADEYWNSEDFHVMGNMPNYDESIFPTLKQAQLFLNDWKQAKNLKEWPKEKLDRTHTGRFDSIAYKEYFLRGVEI